MCDDVPCTWLSAIAYQGLCATGSETLLGFLAEVDFIGIRAQARDLRCT